MMKLPSKIVDISQPLDNETVVDPDFMRPSIRYVTGKENAALMCELFPGLTEDQLPGGEGERYGHDDYIHSGCGVGREATHYLTERGVRVTGIDGWSWDAPFSATRERWLKTRDPRIIWEGHYAGIDTPYCHMEKLRHLEELPPSGFTVACFPCKIKAASGGWTRAVALFD